MKCPNCNQELLDNAKFCSVCGTKIENCNTNETQNANQQMVQTPINEQQISQSFVSDVNVEQSTPFVPNSVTPAPNDGTSPQTQNGFVQQEFNNQSFVQQSQPQGTQSFNQWQGTNNTINNQPYQSSPYQYQAQPNLGEQKESKTWIIVICIVVALLLCCCCGLPACSILLAGA